MWERVGVGLSADDTDLMVHKRNYSDIKDCSFYMMKGWLDSGPVTWSDLLQALRIAGQHETVRELNNALSSRSRDPPSS